MVVHVTARMLTAHARLASKRLHDKGASAAVGNGVQESGENLDSTMFRAHPDASGGVAQALKSGGMCEWLGDRKLACIAFSEAAEKAQGLAAGSLRDDLETQCDFVVEELTSNPQFADLYHQLTTDTGRSVATLTANFMMVYERPKLGPTDGLDNRIAHAEALYDRVQKIKAAEAQQAGLPSVPAGAAPVPPSVPVEPSQIPTQPTAETTNLEVAILNGLISIVKQYDARIADDQKRRAMFAKSIDDFTLLLPDNVAKLKLVPSQTKGPNTMSISAPLTSTGKAAVASTSIWGSLLTLIIPLASQLADTWGHSVNPTLQLAGMVITTGISIFGRVSATTQVTGILKP